MDAPFLEPVPRAQALAAGALARTAPQPGGQFPLTLARARRERGLPGDAGAILSVWHERRTSAVGRTRYPWSVSPRFDSEPIVSPRDWRPWRPRDAEALGEGESLPAFEAGFLDPLVLASTAGELVRLRDAGAESGALGAAILAEHRSKLRRDASAALGERHAWAETWALWCLVHHPGALELLHPFALAIATAYAERARVDGGVVLGSRYPFYGELLSSATAQLAAGLVALGIELDLAGAMIARLRTEERPDGGWGDADGPSDVLTTYVVADLVAGLDPTFDPGHAAWFLASCQEPSGLWRAYGPDAAWLTDAVTGFLAASQQPFANRFRPLAAGLAVVDRRTGLPRFEHYRAVADLAAAVPGLAGARWQVAFLDLIGFREFNNQRGMAEGDRALSVFADELRRVPDVTAIRDGGDEFLAVASPVRATEPGRGLAERMAGFLESWSSRFVREFPSAPPVAPRILVGRAAGRNLVYLRDRLGRMVGQLKHQRGQPVTGFFRDFGDVDGQP